jgi:hypothetical protein
LNCESSYAPTLCIIESLLLQSLYGVTCVSVAMQASVLPMIHLDDALQDAAMSQISTISPVGRG